MSLRCVFVVSLVDTKLLFHKSFPTVEKRWTKEHSKDGYENLPTGNDLVEHLLNELGVLNPTSFQVSRDSCQKNLHAPLFWVPFKSKPDLYWPVVVVESQTRLLCGVPCLNQLHPVKGLQSMSVSSSHEVVMALELLTKLSHLVQLPVVKMAEQMSKCILQWFPFGRVSGQQELELLNKPPVAQKAMWLRAKPKIDIHIKEEVRTMATSQSNLADLYGTITFTIEPEVDCSSISLQLLFSKLARTPSALFHSSALVSWEKSCCNISIQQLFERTFSLCYYSFTLEEPPVQPVLKIRNRDGKQASIFIQLHSSPGFNKSMLNRLEVRLIIPSGNRILRISNNVSQNIGTVSLSKEGTRLIWNLTPIIVSSSSAKLKDDVTMNVDVEMDQLDHSLIEAQALVLFSSLGSTLSGVQLSLLQPSEFKLISTSELKSSVYRVCNQDSTVLVE